MKTPSEFDDRFYRPAQRQQPASRSARAWAALFWRLEILGVSNPNGVVRLFNACRMAAADAAGRHFEAANGDYLWLKGSN